LKLEREIKLVDAGLKWSVLSTNSWQDMMDELRIYVAEKTKEGQEWDGNVPTNYRIKGPAIPEPIPENEADDDKNLGRWINRQRSLYQSGKLRKDREEELETIGLKWSVLSTTSWGSMYETLLEYVRERKTEDPGNEWDGNVPANHKTSDKPPKALGRWINRQRSAYMKDKLKKEFVDKLDAVGLKWAVHERRPYPYPPTPVSSGVTSSPALHHAPKPVAAPTPAATPKPMVVFSSLVAGGPKSSAKATATAVAGPKPVPAPTKAASTTITVGQKAYPVSTDPTVTARAACSKPATIPAKLALHTAVAGTNPGLASVNPAATSPAKGGKAVANSAVTTVSKGTMPTPAPLKPPAPTTTAASAKSSAVVVISDAAVPSLAVSKPSSDVIKEPDSPSYIVTGESVNGDELP
jgi:hypothetical protein